MMVSYCKLFDLLSRRGLGESDLYAVVSPGTVLRLSGGKSVSLRTIDRICRYLHCQPWEIMEIIPDDDGHGENRSE